MVGDETGQIKAGYRYTAYGESRLKYGAEPEMNKYRYTGEQFDEETGFYYLRARYYDPSIGRFVTRDTWAGNGRDPLSLNKYLYASGNPMLFTDPSGHFGLMEVMITSAILGAAIAMPSFALAGGGGKSAGNCVIFVGEHTGGNPDFTNAANTKKREVKSQSGANCKVIQVHSGREMLEQIQDNAGQRKVSEMHYFGHSGSNGLWMYMGHGWESLYTDEEFNDLKYGSDPQGPFQLGSGAASISEMSSSWFNRTAEVHLWGCGSGLGGKLSVAKKIQSQIRVVAVHAFTGMASPHYKGRKTYYKCKNPRLDGCRPITFDY